MMENTNMDFEKEYAENKTKPLGGILGALTGACIGAALWCVISVATDHIYAIIGFLIGLLVGFGYDLFRGKSGVARMVTILVCVILSVTAGTLGSYAWWLHDWYTDECSFIATATKQELAEVYLTPEELAEVNAYPETIKEKVLATLEVTMPSEAEYYRLYMEDDEFVKGVASDCFSSIFFGLLGSLTLILNAGKKQKPTGQEISPEAAPAADNADDMQQEASDADNNPPSENIAG